MRAVFVGTPELSVPTLEALRVAGHAVPLVVTQPDRPAGRGRHLHPPEVKLCALEHALLVFQPDDINAPESLATIRQVEPDVLVVLAFGQILGPGLLSVPKIGCFNMHASLLPAYRGAAPINRAILNGDAQTGVSIIRMTERVDAGGVLAQEKVAIGPDWTAGDLSSALAEVGARLMARVLAEVDAGTAREVKQDPGRASKAPRLAKSDGLIPWGKPAREVHNHVRGMTPWPGAFSFCPSTRSGRRLRVAVRRASVGDETGVRGEPGEVLSVEADGLQVACGEGTILLRELQPAGGRAMSADDFARGHMSDVTMRFTDE